MNRIGTSIATASAIGFASVYLMPPQWLAPLAATAAISACVLAVIIRATTVTEAPASTLVGLLLSLASLPEQPLAKVKRGWALASFLALAAFLVSMALSVLVRAHT